MYMLEYPEEQPEGKNLPPFDFTERDGRILNDIHDYEGMLGLGQIKDLHFTGDYQTRIRMNKIWRHGFVKKANRKWRLTLPDQIFWLSSKGAEYVASTRGLTLDEFHWRKRPRANMIHHDYWLNNFRIAVIKACQLENDATIEHWVTSREFWAFPDTIEVEDEEGKVSKRQVKPDGLVSLKAKGSRFRLLLEIDLQSESNIRFQQQHVRNNLAYLESEEYEARFGFSSGRILVITTSRGRMLNMQAQTAATVGEDARFFCFTTFDAITPETVLSKPIWYQGGETKPKVLFAIS